MLLVMDTAGIFRSSDQLWQQTWLKLEAFLPSLMPDLFSDRQRFSAAETAAAAANAQPVAPVAAPSGDAHVDPVALVEKRVDALKLDEERLKLNESFEDNLPPSPLEPPVRHPTFFIGKEELQQQHDEDQERVASAEEDSAAPGKSVPPKEVGSPEPEIVAPEPSKEDHEAVVQEPTAAQQPPNVAPTVIHFRPSQIIPPPPPTIVSLPSRPTIAPMPPPPLGEKNGLLAFASREES